MIKIFFIGYFLLPFCVLAQGSYAPDAGSLGTTAMHKDSSVFINWAISCQVTRGWQNVLDTTLGRASVGTSSSAIGKSGLNGVVSLGDRGEAILTFQHPVINGVGFDFAVFENSFDGLFLELAFVEVSTNGIDFVRFPAYSETQSSMQIGSFDELDPTNLYNLAGKYKVGYGTPFDLEELADSTSIDIDNINYIKIIDVIGLVNNSIASLDYDLNPINDPFPTPFPTSGFDLDAVGVIHQFVGVKEVLELETVIYPNPSFGNFTIDFNNEEVKNITLYDNFGKVVFNEKIHSKTYNFNLKLMPGVYILKTTIQERTKFDKVIIH